MNDLIFDIGAHKGEDTGFFLHRGFKVVSVDASPDAIKYLEQIFAAQVKSGQLTLVNCAVSDKEGQVSFNISEESLWSSLSEEVATRRESVKNIITVQAKSLHSLIEEYGMPKYCKIDIEGYDKNALQSLLVGSHRPAFISVESECAGGERKLSDDEALETLVLLNKLGYNKFKLVEQAELNPLNPGMRFFHKRLSDQIRLKLQSFFGNRYRDQLNKKFNWVFPAGSSGPFGDEIESPWYNFDTAKALLLEQRNAYFAEPTAVSYGFWCDWHAKLG